MTGQDGWRFRTRARDAERAVALLQCRRCSAPIGRKCRLASPYRGAHHLRLVDLRLLRRVLDELFPQEAA